MYRIDQDKFDELQKDHKNKFLWAILPIAGILVQMEDLFSSIHITKAGFHTIVNINNQKDEPSIKRIIENKKYKTFVNDKIEFAEKEINRKFKILNRNVVINLWTYLESAIKELLIECLKNDKDFYKIKEIEKIKVPFALFTELDENERIFYLIEEYERQSVLNIPYGPKRLIRLLDAFGFNVDIEEEYKRDIFELAQVRNLLLHKNGIVDPFFKRKCPWFDSVLGKSLMITDEMIEKYFNAISMFAVSLIQNISEYVDKKFPEQIPDEFKDIIDENTT